MGLIIHAGLCAALGTDFCSLPLLRNRQLLSYLRIHYNRAMLLYVESLWLFPPCEPMRGGRWGYLNMKYVDCHTEEVISFLGSW